MATKKRVEQLDRLLNWEREDRLPENIELFNRLISPALALREISPRTWEIEAMVEMSEDKFQRVSIPMKHETFVNLALSFLDAVTFSEKR